ncbi:MAG: acetamidase/formamidase family protein, partial [Bryobacteraceae bacterium]
MWLLATATAALGQDVSGTWVFVGDRLGLTEHNRAILTQSGEKITGEMPPNARFEGTLKGGALTLDLRQGERSVAKLVGTLSGAGMRGDGTMFGAPVTWTAHRPAKRPEGASRVHAFEPAIFYRVFSATAPPVLRIFSGDTVRTWSVDAGGRDAQGAARSPGGNPLTGPFYIEGALPGDVVAVKLNRVRLNRDTAGSGTGIVWNAVTPGYVRGLKDTPGFSGAWRLDRTRGVASLEKPSEKLKNYTVPLRPMLGCVALAPPRAQSISTGDSGRFGGNMDYNQIQEGTTVYLPVSQPGALLYVGDGHAAQGDGELTGDALETSMEIEFTVEVLENKRLGGPRAENDEFRMAIGIAGSLDQAMQLATSDLARWIEEDFKLNANESAIVLGTAVR